MKLESLYMSSTYSINSTFSICTTGISKTEMSLFHLPSNISLTKELTPNNKFLLTYKCVFTEKYIQALKWNIPILNVNFIYDLNNYKKYIMKSFEGALFTTAGISSDIYSNYFILAGAVYQPNCSIFIDFLVTDDKNCEKYKFCKKYEIPVISTKDVFDNNFDLFKKTKKYDTKQKNIKSMFFDQIFFLDPNLPEALFNKLKRLIVENEGIRYPKIDDSVNFVFTLDFYKYEKYRSKIYYYQYLFDCVENSALLYKDFYKINEVLSLNILNDCFINFDQIDQNLIKQYINKALCLGGNIQNEKDMRTTHFITNQKIENKQYFCINESWIDECLINFRKIDEKKFFNKNIFNRNKKNLNFQFTGLSSELKIKIITKLKKLNINFIDSENYENCTHLVMGTFSLSEKFLNSLVSGNWIITPDFIENFENQNNFNFSLYEWTPESEKNLKNIKMIDSIRKWRKLINKGKRPFYRWRVKLLCDKKKQNLFSKIIKNGGGSITEEMNCTHVFYDKEYEKETQEKKKYSLDFIFKYLFNKTAIKENKGNV